MEPAFSAKLLHYRDIEHRDTPATNHGIGSEWAVEQIPLDR